MKFHPLSLLALFAPLSAALAHRSVPAHNSPARNTQQTARTQYIEATPGVRTAFRSFGATRGVPLLLVTHFRGTMDDWDPLLVNTLAAQRPVILLDYAGVGKSSGGAVARSVREETDHVAAVLRALDLKGGKIDALGFSMGGMVVQLLALNHPELVRKLVVAGSSPSGGPGVLRTPNADSNAIATLPAPAYEGGFEVLFFAPTESSQRAGRAFWARKLERSKRTSGEERSELLSWEYRDGGAGIKAQGEALTRFADPATSTGLDGSYERLGNLTKPLLVANGHDDYMIPTVNSFVLQQRAPNARLLIYPDSGHGFLFQFPEDFAQQVNQFLERNE